MQPAAVAAESIAPAPSADFKTELAALEQKLRDEIRATRDNGERVASSATIDVATMRRVQQLIGEAEQRHSRELAARMIEFSNDMNMQRRADLANVSRAINAQNAQMIQQRQYLNNVIRVSNTPQQ